MSKQEGFAPLFLILGIAIISTIAVASYLYFSNNQPSSIEQPAIVEKTTPLNIPQPSQPICYTKPDLKNASQVRQMDVKSKFLGNQDFPAEITSLCDNQLKVMGCLYPYTRRVDGEYIFTSTETSELGTKSISLQVTEPDILDNINRLTGKLNGKKPDSIRYCSIGQGDLLAGYNLLTDKTANYALLLAQGGVDILASIPSNDLTNFSCNEPIMLTTDNLFYIQCSGKNESAVTKSIYKIDLEKRVSTKLFECISTGVSNIGDSNVTCQNFLPTSSPITTIK